MRPFIRKKCKTLGKSVIVESLELTIIINRTKLLIHKPNIKSYLYEYLKSN